MCAGSGDGPAGGAAAGMGRGDPGRRSSRTLGEAVVPRSADGCHHPSLYVSALRRTTTQEHVVIIAVISSLLSREICIHTGRAALVHNECALKHMGFRGRVTFPTLTAEPRL